MNRFILFPLLLVSAVTLAQISPHPKLAQAQAEYRQAAAQHDTLAMAEAAYLMGKRYRKTADYVSARRWLLRSLRIQEPRGPSIELNKVYVQLAGDAMTIGEYAEAFSYAHRALTNSRKLNHPHSLMSAYSVLGSMHWQLVKQRSAAHRQTVNLSDRVSADSAVWYMQQAETISLRLNDPKEIAGIHFAKGTMLAEPEPRRAIPLLTYALRVYDKHGKYNNCVALHVKLADAAVSLHQLSAARQHLMAARQLSQTHTLIDADVLVRLQDSWANWHRVAGHWQRAYNHLRVADSLRQVSLTTEQRAVIARLNVTYETDRRESLLKTQRAELTLHDTTLRVQRQYTHTASGLLMLAVTVAFMFYRLSRQNKHISLQNAQLVQEQNHRMKNNLQTISALLSLQSNRLADGDAKRAVEESQLRVQTMALLNRKLYDTDQIITSGLPTVIPDVVRSILDSYGCGAVEPVYELAPVPIHVDQAVPIVLIINELVTNACKYAFPDHPAPTLLVRCWQEDGRIRLCVQDNGPGTLVTMDSGGFGLRLISIQVRQLRGECAFGGPPGVTFDLSAPMHPSGSRPVRPL